MIFGDSLRAATSTEQADWIAESIGGQPWTVGALVPNRYESVLRLHAPDPAPDGWWDQYRDLFDLVASLGARYTSTPTLAWFAIWEGHGFGASTTHLAWKVPPADDAERRWRQAERDRQRIADDEHNATIRAALASIPRFERPGRAYYLTHGPLTALTDLRHPRDRSTRDRSTRHDDWQRPDLFWPDDRSWFAATDVDFWSLYVGGAERFTSELAAHASTPCEFVHDDDRLPVEE